MLSNPPYVVSYAPLYDNFSSSPFGRLFDRLFGPSLRSMQRPEPCRDQAPLAVLAVVGRTPIKQPAQGLLLAKRRLDAHGIWVVVADKASVTADALGGNDALVDVFTGLGAGKVAVFKGAVGVTAPHTRKLVAGAGGVGADKGAAIEGDAQQNLLCGHPVGHQVLHGRRARGFVFADGVKLRVVAAAGGPGPVQVVGGEVDEVDAVGDLPQVKDGQSVGTAGQRGREIVTVLAKVHADLSQQGYKVGGLLGVGWVDPVDVDAVEAGRFDESQGGAGKIVPQNRAGGDRCINGGGGAAADGQDNLEVGVLLLEVQQRAEGAAGAVAGHVGVGPFVGELRC